MAAWEWIKARFNTAIKWIGGNLSSDPTNSNSRLLQTVIVLGLLPMVWIIVGKADWKLEDNPRIVIVTLIVSGAGAYAAGKAAER